MVKSAHILSRDCMELRGFIRYTFLKDSPEGEYLNMKRGISDEFFPEGRFHAARRGRL